MRKGLLSAQAIVDVPVDQARGWFVSLRDNPGLYRFDTHDGFEFVDGSFGEVGALFRTRERFLGLDLKLLFELTEVGESEFTFQLARPRALGIWGGFSIVVANGDRSRLALHVGSDAPLGRLMLHFFPVKRAVGRQIEREVEYVKTSMERGSEGS
jgi:hypothetical protein